MSATPIIIKGVKYARNQVVWIKSTKTGKSFPIPKVKLRAKWASKFARTTNVPEYDNMLKNARYFRTAKGRRFKIEYQTPDQYIDSVARGFYTQKTMGKKGREWWGSVDNIKKEIVGKRIDPNKMAALDFDWGKPFPMPIIDVGVKDYGQGKFYSFWQEGIHRALHAKKKGIKRIPVMVVRDVKRKK